MTTDPPRPPWPQRLRAALSRRLGPSLKARLVLVFLALALGTAMTFLTGTRELFSTGWRALARPLVADYLDRLAADIGSPPDLARAQALVQRLPLSIHIDGAQRQWSSHPQRDADARHGDHGHAGQHGQHGQDRQYDPQWRSLLERRSAAAPTAT